MKTIQSTFGQLDQETQEYLSSVHSQAGRRCPGIYIEFEPNPLIKIALWTGPIILLVGLVVSLNSGKDAFAVAMFLAGTVLLGSWITWYGVRGLLGETGKRFYGRFLYFDPVHVYLVRGDEVAVTNIGSFEKVYARDNGVVFVEEGRKTLIPIQRAAKAELVERYYRGLLDVESHNDPKWQKLSLAELGGVSKHIATEGGIPISKESASLRIDTVPENPTIEGGGLPMRLLFTFGLAAMALLLGMVLFKPIRDSGNFSRAKEGGAPGLRGYLMDERNTSHRTEAKKLLAALYDAPIAKVKTSVPEDQAQFRDAFVGLIESLRDASQPVVSLKITEQGESNGKEYRENTLRTELADALGMFVGQELIAFVKNPDDQNAHVEIQYTYEMNGDTHWTLSIRPQIEDPAVTLPVQTFRPASLATVPTALKSEFFKTYFNQTAPVVPPPQDMGEF